ncbi:MAG TPA: AAA family ATPase [Gemmataceae bacterium]|nr:AAA family ATPase [Gemmataceae bacterium]
MGTTDSVERNGAEATCTKLVRWLWPNVIPRGYLSIIDGDPGVAKSVITIDLAARATRGAPWPDGSAGADPGDVLLICGEDGKDDTVMPRLIAAGADPGRVTVIATPDDPLDPIILPRDLKRIETIVRDKHPALVVLDPLTVFLPTTGPVRKPMTDLVRLAGSSGAAIVFVRHLIKELSSRAIHRGLGSVGIIGSARTGLLAAQDPFDPSRFVLTSTKSNLGPPPPTQSYRVGVRNGQAVIEWLGPTTTTADDAAHGPRRTDRPGEVQAAQFLVEELGKGEQPAAELLKRALAAGISERTLHRAKAALNVDSRMVRIGDKRAWAWSLTDSRRRSVKFDKLPELDEIVEVDFDDDW